MQRPPRPPGAIVFAGGMQQHILWVGLAMGGISLLTQAGAIHLGLGHRQTMVLTVLTLSQMSNVLAIRSERERCSRRGCSPICLLGAVLATLVLQLMTIYLTALNSILKTAPLSLPKLAACLAPSGLTFAMIEAEKLFARRGLIYR
jgi:Ca2+-transporting ATPase